MGGGEQVQEDLRGQHQPICCLFDQGTEVAFCAKSRHDLLGLMFYTIPSQEREQRVKDLGFRDRIALTSGRFLLSNK